MEEKNTAANWDIKLCPVRNKQCIEEQCAWWNKEKKECAVLGIDKRIDKQ